MSANGNFTVFEFIWGRSENCKFPMLLLSLKKNPGLGCPFGSCRNLEGGEWVRRRWRSNQKCWKGELAKKKYILGFPKINVTDPFSKQLLRNSEFSHERCPRPLSLSKHPLKLYWLTSAIELKAMLIQLLIYSILT